MNYFVLVFVLALTISSIDFASAQKFSLKCPNGKTYTLATEGPKANFEEALGICQRYHQRLATIRDPPDNMCIAQLIKNSPFAGVPFWTSATDAQSPNNFVWKSTGQPCGFNNWHDGQPTHDKSPQGEIQHCVHVSYPNPGVHPMQWFNDWCSTRYFFICEV